MKVMQKILFIAIIGLLGWNTEGMIAPSPAQTVFDLPNDTPGLMPDKQKKKVCGVDKDCVHVIVLGSRAQIALHNGDIYDDLYEAMETEGNIYFPADGHQPTTLEAVQYSSANIDNRENSPITEWYMKISCVIPLEGKTFQRTNSLIKFIVPKRHILKTQRLLKQLAANPNGRLLWMKHTKSFDIWKYFWYR